MQHIGTERQLILCEGKRQRIRVQNLESQYQRAKQTIHSVETELESIAAAAAEKEGKYIGLYDSQAHGLVFTCCVVCMFACGWPASLPLHTIATSLTKAIATLGSTAPVSQFISSP